MTHALDEPAESFLRVLANAKDLISLIDNCRKFASISAPDDPVPPDSFVASSVQLHLDVKKSSVSLTILSGTLLLYLAGQFENFIKESMKIVADEYSSKCTKFEQLPVSLQNHLLSQTAEAVQKPTKYNFEKPDTFRLIVQLAANINAVNGIGQLNSDLLVITETNMRPETLSDLLKRFEIKDVWKEVAKQTRTKLFLQNEKEIEVEKILKEKLNEIMEARNKVAHPSSAPEFPDASKVKEFIDYLELLSSVLVEILKQKCVLFKPVTAGAS
jgi:hypothetical protein